MMTREYYQKRQQLMKESQIVHAELRRKIRIALRASGGMMTVAQICDALPEEDQRAIQQELYMLSRHPKSDVFHNGTKGRGSMYSIGLTTVEE
jgi:hypothetical protein